MVQVLDERVFDPPRRVEVELDGSWWLGWQSAWRLCDDDRGWMADVEFTAQHSWGPGKYKPMVPPHRVRLPGNTSPESVDGPGLVDDSRRRSPVT